MKKELLTMAVGITTLTACTGGSAADNAINLIIAQMTPEEKAAFVIGTNRVQETPPDAPECVTKYPMIDPSYQAEADKYGVRGWDKLTDFVATYQTEGKVQGAAGKSVVIVLDMGNIIDMNDVLAANPDAVLHAWLGGQEAGNSIADVLSGKVNPSGRLPMTWAKRYEDYASAKNFLFSQGDSIVRYEEDIYVGYRQFDRDKIQPLYPFGYGLSYTSFDYTDLKASADGDAVNVEVTVKNTGRVAGREVVQIYVSAPQSAEGKPVKELKAFGKTGLIPPGATETLTMTISRASLASWTDNGWKVDDGMYVIHAATNADNILKTVEL